MPTPTPTPSPPTISIDPAALNRLLDEAVGVVPGTLPDPRQKRINDCLRRSRSQDPDEGSLVAAALVDLISAPADPANVSSARLAGIPSESALTCHVAGLCAIATQDFADAQRLLDRAVRIDPNRIACWTLLGRLASQLNQPELAVKYHQRAVVISDCGGESDLELARIHSQNGRLKDAIHTLRVALMSDRNHPAINRALAQLLRRRAMMLGRQNKRLARHKILEERLQCLQTANRAAPRSDSYLRQGRLESRLEHFEQSRVSFQRALDLNPTSEQAITHLASANVDDGKIAEAIEQFQQALKLNPNHAVTHFRYTRTKRFGDDDVTRRYIDQLRQRLEAADLPSRDRIFLHFAVAKVFDDIGEYDDAWQHYDIANRLKPGHHATIATPPSQTSGRDASAGRLATEPSVPPPPSVAQSGAEAASDSEMKDSPKHSPLKKIADDAIRFFTKDFFANNQKLGVVRPDLTPIFVIGMPRSGTTLTEQILTSHPSIAGGGELKAVNQMRRTIEHEVRVAHRELPKSATGYPDALMHYPNFELQRLANQYLDILSPFRDTETFVTDKMPTNFMHLGLLSLLFPNAKFVHCKRDPMDVLVSCFCQNLNPPFCDLETLAGYFRRYQEMMDHFESVLPTAIHSVQYEQTVTEPESTARQLIEYCGLDWDPACLSFHENSRSVRTPSKWQVRQPMYTSSVGKWKRFEKHLQTVAGLVGQVD